MIYDELERTPGTAAVSGIYGEDAPEGTPLSGIPSTNPSTLVDIPSPPYLEPIAKRSADLDSILAALDVLMSKKSCPSYFIQGSCENGHRYAKELYCGREWCPVCGAEWSASHQRRFARWLPKATQIRSMGYFVFTVPEELRNNYRTKEALTKFGHHIQEMMKFFGYTRGLRRWHFFGDKSNKWNPHLNVLVDAGYIPDDKLETIKKAYAVLLGVDIVDIHYHYRQSAAQKVHILKYVTRATFLDYKWDPEMALELNGFRNQLWWGVKEWDERLKVWSLADLEGSAAAVDDTNFEAVESLESGICPRCGKPIDWGRVQLIEVLRSEPCKRDLGAGYWDLQAVSPPLLLNTVAIKLAYNQNAHGDPGGHYNRTFDAFHARHRAFAENWYNEKLAKEALDDMLDQLAGRGNYAI